jgi:hypothetical protein
MKTIHFTVLALVASAHSAELNHLSTAVPPAGNEPPQVRQLGDVSPPDVVEFVSTEFRTIETDGVQSLTVHRPWPADNPVAIQYRVIGGTAAMGEDYLPESGTLAWAANDGASQSISVTILDDPFVELEEAVFIELFAPAGGAVLSSRATARLAIMDNELRARIDDPSYAANQPADSWFFRTITHWSPITTNTLQTTVFRFTEPPAERQRFYRLFQTGPVP